MFILLFLLWLALNGRVTQEIVVLGLAISGIVYYFMCKFLDYSPKGDVNMVKNALKTIKYIFVLLYEMIKSSFLVLKFVFAKDIEIQPQIVFFKVPLKNEFLKTILANSITLTPGTITLNVEEDVFCVHALDYTLAQGIENLVFIKLLQEMEDNL